MASADPPAKPDPDRLIYAGLLGLATTAVFGLAGKTLDTPLRLAVYAFAAGIPLLAGCMLAAIGRARHSPPLPPSRFAVVAGAAAALLTVVGLGGFFWHHGRPFLAVYVAATAVTFPAVRRM